MKTYTITKKIKPLNWSDIPVLEIDNVLWRPDTGIRAKAQICYDETALYVHLQATEANIRAEESGPLGSPWEDSCLEFFFSPICGDMRYFNVEFNPNGCLCLGLGGESYGWIRLLPDVPAIIPKVQYTQDGWNIEYSIPFTLIRQFFPDFSPISGNHIRANCYKCGDLTPKEHYLSWNPIDLPEPKFHAPEFFGKMIFE